jgi:hypothetical protein
MTNEELDEARADEALRLWGQSHNKSTPRVIAARLAREGWTPPEPVDPDVLAVREVLARSDENEAARRGYLAGRYDSHNWFQSALAAYKAGREQEQERAKVLVEALGTVSTYSGNFGKMAAAALAAYKAGRAAR